MVFLHSQELAMGISAGFGVFFWLALLVCVGLAC